MYSYGIKYEPKALHEYEKFMFNRKTAVPVLKSGLVVSKGFPVLDATQDVKIVDFGCSVCFGLAELSVHGQILSDTMHALIEPFSWRGSIKITADFRGTIHTILRFRDKWASLGQSDVTIMYTNKGLYVQRIAFHASLNKTSRVNYSTYILNIFLVLQ